MQLTKGQRYKPTRSLEDFHLFIIYSFNKCSGKTNILKNCGKLIFTY